MIVLREVTQWADPIPNHTYLLSDDKSKMLAYVRQGTDELTVFSKPLGFSTRGRKFVATENRWGWTPPVVVKKNPTWQVQGSKGSVYTVEKTHSGYRCTCSGFRFRGQCKHIAEISA